MCQLLLFWRIGVRHDAAGVQDFTQKTEGVGVNAHVITALHTTFTVSS